MIVIIEKLIKAYHEKFKESEKPRVFFAPGRVNLIGEHTDYNGGHVLPCALKRGTYVAASKRNDNKIVLYSINVNKKSVTECFVSEKYKLTNSWVDYPKGVIQILSDEGYKLNTGVNLCYFGNIPSGAGLSSSASIELATSVALNNIFDFNLEAIDLVKYSQKAENDFVGVKCGIMDQFIIGMGKEEKAVLLDTNTLEYSYTNVELGKYSLIIANSNKKRGLADSKYNERFDQCKKALEEIKEIKPINSLGDLTEEEFIDIENIIRDDVIKKRAKHAVYENQRTIKAHKALDEGRLKDFGFLMNESHKSLKEDYEVTGIELDTLVELSQNFDGVIGSRMTGAGFGGCTVTLIEKNKVDDFIENVGKAYKKAIGYAAYFYLVEIGDGARELVI